MGGLHPADPHERLERHLPNTVGAGASDCDPAVLSLLEGGRSGEAGFDLQQAPVAAYLYRLVGEAKCAEQFQSARSFFAGALDARGFLVSQDRGAVVALASAAARIARTRREALQVLSHSL